MIKASDIYAASHDGLDIILYYYPQAEGCVDNRKKFKIRPDEDDASACIRKYGDCYKVTDFGDQGTAISPIDICMREEPSVLARPLSCWLRAIMFPTN